MSAVLEKAGLEAGHDAIHAELVFEHGTGEAQVIHAGELAFPLTLTCQQGELVFEQLRTILPMTDCDPETLAWIAETEAGLRALTARLSALPPLS